MNDPRLSKISALFDGELETHEVRVAIQASVEDAERWRLYGLIGDSLRGEPIVAPDLTVSVMARISEEPVVLAPRNLKPLKRRHPFLALAASVAGVAVVGWVALTGNSQLSETHLALSKKEPVAVLPAPTFVQAQQTTVSGEMSEYLLAHHAQAGSTRLGDSTRQIRTVAIGSPRP